MKPSERVTLDLWHDYSETELAQESKKAVQAILSYDQIEDEKKVSAADFTQRLSDLRSEMRMLSTQVRNRGVLQATDCKVFFHQPHVGVKQIYREDTGELVKEEAMTPNECQEYLFPEVETAVDREIDRERPRNKPPMN